MANSQVLSFTSEQLEQQTWPRSLPTTQAQVTQYIRIHEFTQFYISSQNEKELQEYLIPSLMEQSHCVGVCGTVKRIKWLIAGVFTLFFLTFLIFPGVVLQASSPSLSPGWFAVLAPYVYNWADMLGRYSCDYFMLLKPKMVWIGILLRFVLFWTILMAAAPNTSPDWLFHSDWFIFLNLFLFGFSNGHLASICMISGPQQVASNQRETAGMAMNISLCSGIMAGAMAAQFGMASIDLSSI